MIGFTVAALNHYSKLQPTPLEELESIDMMRLLENNYEINAVISSSPILGVDNPEDIAKSRDHDESRFFTKYLSRKISLNSLMKKHILLLAMEYQDILISRKALH